MYYITGKLEIYLKKPVIYASKKASTKSGRIIKVAFGSDTGSKTSSVSIGESD